MTSSKRGSEGVAQLEGNSNAIVSGRELRHATRDGRSILVESRLQLVQEPKGA